MAHGGLAGQMMTGSTCSSRRCWEAVTTTIVERRRHDPPPYEYVRVYVRVKESFASPFGTVTSSSTYYQGIWYSTYDAPRQQQHAQSSAETTYRPFRLFPKKEESERASSTVALCYYYNLDQAPLSASSKVKGVTSQNLINMDIEESGAVNLVSSEKRFHNFYKARKRESSSFLVGHLVSIYLELYRSALC